MIHSKHRLLVSLSFSKESCSKQPWYFSHLQITNTDRGTANKTEFNNKTKSLTEISGYTAEAGLMVVEVGVSWMGTVITFASYVRVLQTKVHSVITGGSERSIGRNFNYCILKIH